MLRLLLLLFPALIPLSVQVCSWDNCNQWSSDPNVLNVHLVTHTHDDMGWLKTVDQYYWGSKQDVVDVGVQYIYDTVIAELEKSPDRRFSFAETGFFYRWWISNSPADQQRIVKLVQNGQLEWIGGGWTQNDEAAEHYVDMIDQMTYGLKKLTQIFGECGKAKVAWQIDPFGHSREFANLFSQIGYEGLFFARIHYLDKKQRLANKTLEFQWSGSEDYTSNILTGAFFQDNYNPPDGFCFDMRCRDDPIMDNPNLEGYNLDAKIKDFMSKIKNQANHLRTNHVLLTMGSDFHYTNANEVFRNLDRLIAGINKNETHYGARLFYSTPSCYVQGLQAAKVDWSTKTDDFFPYANSALSFWTGYFTSRPTFKGMIREASSLLQLAKRLDAMAGLGQASDGNVDTMSRASALCQHHDAVTGTAKQVVSDDYYKHLDIGFSASDPVVNDFLSSVMTKDPMFPAPRHTMCHTINETVCTVIQNANIFTVTVFNPSGVDMESVVTVPFYQNQAEVLDDQGNDVEFQVFKTFHLPLADHQTKNIAPKELSFTVEVPALGYRTYVVDTTQKTEEDTVMEEEPVTNVTTIENEFILLTFDAEGYISSYLDKSTNTTHDFRQQFFFYHGTEYPDPQPSGAYIFRPTTQDPFELNNTITIEVSVGSQSQEVRQTISEGIAYQIVRLRKGSPAVEFEWTIGPLPKETLPQRPITKEVVTRYITNINSNDVFYTDANGRQMMQRTVDQYPSFKYENTEPTSGNYYPITSRVYIKDQDNRMTVLTDRSHGGSSRDGMIEIMLHRRCFSDDHFGVNEALDEPGVDKKGLIVKGVHHVVLGNLQGAATADRAIAMQKFYKPVLTFAPLQSSADILAHYNLKFSGLKNNLPPTLNLLSLEHWDTNTILVRFENILQKSEGGTDQVVDLGNLFTTINVMSVKEVKLGANRDVSDWTTQNFQFTIGPQQIRSFLIQTAASAAPSSTITAMPSSTAQPTSQNPSSPPTSPTIATTTSSAQKIYVLTSFVSSILYIYC